MYFIGVDHPDREPTRNRFAEKDRKSKFTEKVAKEVVDGDLYFSQRVPAAMRYFIEVEAGEHGREDGGLICVTHQYRKPYAEFGGKWEAYDGGGNIVIKVRGAADSDFGYEALNAIESALYHTPLGRVVGRDALRAQAESLCTTFGIPIMNNDAAPRFEVNKDQERAAKDALLDLLTYGPERGYDERLGAIGAEFDGVGFAEDAEEYARLLDGESNGFGDELEKGHRKALPLLSQPVFYAVLGGKGDGRGMQARIDALMAAVGLTEDELNEAYR